MNISMLLLTAVYALPSIGGVLAFYGWLQLRGFKHSHPAICTQLELDHLKRIVKADMLMALALIVICVATVILVLIAINFGYAESNQLKGLYVLGPLAALAGFLVTAQEYAALLLRTNLCGKSLSTS